MKINPANVRFILVEPMYPGNIGSSARALKSMGFSDLLLVNPCDIQDAEAQRLAHASEDVLNSARIFASLEEAIEDCHFVVATTQRHREYRFPYFTPDELAQKAIPLSGEGNIAIVFGRERSGLTNEEIRLCDAISTAPAAVSHPSLNLAQAVLVYAYELHKGSFEDDKKFSWKPADQRQILSVYEHLEKSLRRVDFQPRDNWDKFIMRFRRLLGRAHPEVRDVQLLHKILQAFDEYIDPPGKKGIDD